MVANQALDFKGAIVVNGSRGAPTKATGSRRSKREDGDGDQTQVEKILDLVSGVEFFHDTEMAPYARVTESKRVIVAPVDGKDFKLVIRRRYYNQYRSGPNDES